MPRPFAVIGFTVFFTLALLYNAQTGVTAAALAAYAAALVVTLFMEKVRKQRVLPCAFASGALACALLLCNVNFMYLPAVSYSGKTCKMTAVLISEPELEYGNYYYTAKATEIDGEKVDLKLRLTFSAHPEAEPYDKISGDFSFYTPGASSEKFLASNKANGVFLAAYPLSENYSVINVPESEKPIGKTIIDIRNAIKQAVYRMLPDERGALAVALLIGDKSGLPSEILNDFRTVGISHIICVSGFHLSLWSMLFFEILKKLKLGEKLASIVSAFAVIGFMLVSGLTYSVARAGIMMLVFLLSNFVMRRRDSLNSLGFALTVIALFNPFAMGSVSLQLSALATLGIILYSQHFAEGVRKSTEKIKFKPARFVIQKTFFPLMVTAAATAFTLPVSLSLYGGFNFAVFAANLVAVPIAGACMVFCAVGAFIGSISVSVFNVVGFAGGFLAKILIRFASAVADIDWLAFKIEDDESSIIICAVLSVCLFAVIMAYFGKAMPRIACMVSATVFIVTLLFFSVSGQGKTKIRIIDCGNGTAVVASCAGESILVGCGGTTFLGSMYVCDAINAVSGDIDALIIPDSEAYSTSYLNRVLSEYTPEKIFCNELPRGSSLLLKDTEKHSFGSMNYFGEFAVKSARIKDSSCVLIKNKDVSALVCFDPIENFFDFPEDFRTADVIITRSDYPKEIERFNSKLVVINAENPRGIILQNEISDLGINCAATAGCGNIVIKADGGFVSAYRE